MQWERGNVTYTRRMKSRKVCRPSCNVLTDKTQANVGGCIIILKSLCFRPSRHKRNPNSNEVSSVFKSLLGVWIHRSSAGARHKRSSIFGCSIISILMQWLYFCYLLLSCICLEPDDVRLVGGASHCVGRLEMKHKGDWRPAADRYSYWNLMSAAVVCRQLDCGSALSTGRREDLDFSPAWIISSSCGQSETAIRECTSAYPLSAYTLEVNCSGNTINGNSFNRNPYNLFPAVH